MITWKILTCSRTGIELHFIIYIFKRARWWENAILNITNNKDSDIFQAHATSSYRTAGWSQGVSEIKHCFYGKISTRLKKILIRKPRLQQSHVYRPLRPAAYASEGNHYSPCNLVKIPLALGSDPPPSEIIEKKKLKLKCWTLGIWWVTIWWKNIQQVYEELKGQSRGRSGSLPIWAPESMR